MDAARAALTCQIRQHYPDAEFPVFQGGDPEGTYLLVTVDTDDTEALFAAVADILYTY